MLVGGQALAFWASRYAGRFPYVRDRLDAGDAGAAKAARRLDERIYRFAWENRHARNVFRDHAIDPFDAVLVDDRLGESFCDRRYPDMRRNLERRRTRGTVT